VSTTYEKSDPSIRKFNRNAEVIRQNLIAEQSATLGRTIAQINSDTGMPTPLVTTVIGLMKTTGIVRQSKSEATPQYWTNEFYEKTMAELQILPLASITADTLAFVDGGGGDDTITDSDSSFVSAGFTADTEVTIDNSTSNDQFDLPVTAVIAGTLTVPTGTLTTESAGATVTISSESAVEEYIRENDNKTNVQMATAIGCHNDIAEDILNKRSQISEVVLT
jgi:hypothetical protein